MGSDNPDDGHMVATCADCGNEYPIGGSVHKNPVEGSPESAEHHEPGCPIRKALEKRGQTADRDVHRELDTGSNHE